MSRSAALFLMLAGCGLSVDDRVGGMLMDHDSGGGAVSVEGDAALARPRPALGPVEMRDPTWDDLLAQARVLPEESTLAPGLRRVTIEPVGRFAMTLESTRASGCSRGMSSTRARGALTLDLAADGAATVCRARITDTTTRALEAVGRYQLWSSTRRERTGYRGRWERLEDGAFAIAMVRDDAGCDPVAEGAPPLTAPLVLRCTPIAGRLEGRGVAWPAVALPGRGLACTPMGETRHEHDNWDAGIDASSIVLGPGDGWSIRRARRPGVGSQLAITRRTEPTSVADILDPAHTFSR